MQLEDIKKLAEIARIDIEEGELLELARDFENILGYVSHINEAGVDYDDTLDANLKNIYREDEITNSGGEFTKDIINEMPDSEGDFLRVKKIL